MKKLLIVFAFAPLICLGQRKISVSQIKSDGLVVFKCSESDHGELLNQTREESGAGPLKRSPQLDSLALQRCLRIAHILKDSSVTLFKTFDRQVHEEAKTSENGGISVYASPFFAGKKISLTEEDAKLLFLKWTKSFNDPPSGIFYNDSPGHLRNRTEKNWKEFGESSILVFIEVPKDKGDTNPFAPDITVKMLWINYELFR